MSVIIHISRPCQVDVTWPEGDSCTEIIVIVHDEVADLPNDVVSCQRCFKLVRDRSIGVG